MTLRILSAAPDAAELLDAAVAAERAAQVATWGHADLAETVAEAAAWGRDQTHARHERFLATDDDHPGSALGMALLELPTSDNTHIASGWVAVDPACAGRGVGSALARHLEQAARAAGRTLMHTWTDHAVAPRPREGPPDAARDDDEREEDDEEETVVVPTTGRGAVPRDGASRFALGRGFVLEQVERHSVLALPVPADRLDRLGAHAAAVAGPDYRLRTWTDAAPEEMLDPYAVLHTRMSTDVPLGGLEFEEEVFDGPRVRELERLHRDSGHRLLVAVAEHVPTGVLAGFTMLTVREGEHLAVHQDSTLVLRNHRGHRLGLLVKVANVRALGAAFPTATRVHTWNAAENAPMLAVNDALGFTPGGVQGQWQKRLAL